MTFTSPFVAIVATCSGNKLTRKDNAVVECSLCYTCGPKTGTPTDFCENLIYLKCTAQAHIPKFLKPSLESVTGRYNQVTAMVHNQKSQLVIHGSLHDGGHTDYKGD